MEQIKLPKKNRYVRRTLYPDTAKLFKAAWKRAKAVTNPKLTLVEFYHEAALIMAVKYAERKK